VPIASTRPVAAPMESSEAAPRLTASARRSAVAVASADAVVQGPPHDKDALPPPALHPPTVRAIDGSVRRCIQRKEIPGAVVTVVRNDAVVFQRAYGNRQLEPAVVPMTSDTVFDLASLTKPIVTATLVLMFVEDGVLSLTAPAARYLPRLAASRYDRVTIEQLLRHTAGLPAANPLSDFDDRDALLARIAASRAVGRPGAKRTYSDVGYIVLGELLTRVSGRTLDELATQRIFAPLRLSETRFLPPPALTRRAAPTEKRRGRWLRGEVHDPRAARMGGVAGHAGLFSTAADLARVARMLLAGGELDGVRILSPDSVRRMLEGGLAFPASAGGFAHTGFTGTYMWLDPERQLAVITLSNRVHPAGKGSHSRLRRAVRELVKGGP